MSDYNRSYPPRRPDSSGYRRSGYVPPASGRSYPPRSDYPYRQPPRRQAPPPRRKPDNSGLVLIAIFAVIIIIAVILCSVLLGNRQSGDNTVPAAAWTSQPSAYMQPTAYIQATPTPVPQITPTPAPPSRMVTDYTVLSGVPNTDKALGLPENGKVNDAYFDNCVFIGDSVSLKLTQYVRNMRKEYPSLLGTAPLFLTAGSLGSGEALEPLSSKSLHPSYMGKKMLLEDAVAASGARKVFIMLGMNDIAPYGIEGSANNMITLIERIMEKSPGIQVFIQSATPRIKGEYQKLNNNALFEYNLKLYEYSRQNESRGVYFLDIAYIMRDQNGDLPTNYCSDVEGMGMHFNNTACKLWIEYLYTHTL